jgi:carbonic anhydrase
MRLFEAIVEANNRAVSGDKTAGLHPADHADSLPVIALTCIDPRLNRLLPDALGITEEQFIWLRNSGNIIFEPMSSMMRTLALACAVKGGKEIAVIGHTDCHVQQTSVSELTERFRALGIDRTRLPDNLNEFFGLFASERQNVINAAATIRSSPLIGPKVPVHGFLMDINSGRLEWLVNGYQPTPAVSSEVRLEAKIGGTPLFDVGVSLPAFQLGEMKFPDFKIGDLTLQVGTAASSETAMSAPTSAAILQPLGESEKPKPAFHFQINPALKYKILGSDRKEYGPVLGAKILEWLTEGRIDGQTPAQVETSAEWRPLAALGELLKQSHIPLPPPLRPTLHVEKGKKPGPKKTGKYDHGPYL